MAKFVVNPNTHDEQTVEAEKFHLSNDYWYFYDANDKIRHVIVAKNVEEIERREN